MEYRNRTLDTFVWYRAGPSLAAGSMAATVDNSLLSATCCVISAKSPGKRPRPRARTAAPSLQGRQRAMDISCTTSANNGATHECRGSTRSKRSPGAMICGLRRAERQPKMLFELLSLGLDPLRSRLRRPRARCRTGTGLWGGGKRIDWAVPAFRPRPVMIGLKHGP